MFERNEVRHKELIKKANDGAAAIVELRKDYDNLTVVEYSDGAVLPISDIITPDHDIGKFKER